MDGWPMSLCTPWRHVRKKKLPISVPVRRSDLSMAKSRPPHSGDSCVAARLALAFDLKPRSSLHVFHTSKPCVTCMSIPLVLTLTSPAGVDLDVRAVVMVGIAKHLLADGVPGPVAAIAAVECHPRVRGHCRGLDHLLVQRQILCRLQQVHAGDVVLPLAADDGRRSRPLGPVPAPPGSRALTRAASALPRPGGNGLPCPSVTHSRAAIAVGHRGDVGQVKPRGWPGTSPPSPGSEGTARL
jgi:hypothetical protein